MTGPTILARPLAARVAGLPAAGMAEGDALVLPQTAVDAAVAALDRGETHYTTRPGIVALRGKVSGQLRTDYGIDVPIDDITITCGREEARFSTVRTLVDSGTSVLCPGSNELISGAVHLAGAALSSGLDRPEKVGLLYLSSEDPMEVVEKALQSAAKHGWWVVWELSRSSQPSGFHPAQSEILAPQVVTIGGWDDVLSGWRVGWMAGSKVAGRLRSFKQSMTICTTNVSQWTALALMETE